MSTLLKEHIETFRMFQACGAEKTMGTALPDDILNQLTAAIASDNIDALHQLLEQYFPNRNGKFPGAYHVRELYPCLSQAARHDQVDILRDEILLPYTHLRHAFDFVAREAADAHSKNTLQLLLDHGWDVNWRGRGPGTTVLESFLYDSTPARDSNAHRDIAYWLVEHGAGLNERPNHTDTTGMSQAVQRAPVEFVRELLDHHGGDAQKGQLLHHALRRTSTTGTSDTIEMLRLLLDRGAPLNLVLYASDERSARNFRPMNRGTPLHEAAKQGSIEVVEFLLAQGADTSIM